MTKSFNVGCNFDIFLLHGGYSAGGKCTILRISDHTFCLQGDYGILNTTRQSKQCEFCIHLDKSFEQLGLS